MIQLSGVRKTYQVGDVEVRALRGVDLAIKAGEFVAIMGPSGSGKSTLMHLMGLLDIADGGSYLLAGRETTGLSQDEMAALRAQVIGFVFQQFNLLPRMSALENAALPLLYAPNGASPSRPRELLQGVGLGERLEHTPRQLSGGQQQRVAIARALVNRPRVILADEPTGNLDSASSEEILTILSELNRQGITVVVVTHEQEIAARARRVIRMKDGVIQSDERAGPPGPRSPVPFDELRVNAPPTFNLKEAADYFRQAARALLANKVRSGLSMLGILIGVAAVIAMLALGGGARESIEARLSSLGSNLLVLRPGSRQARGVALESGSVTRLTLADAEAIRAEVPEVRRTVPSVTGRGQLVYGANNWNTRIEGVTPDYAPARNAMPVIGRFFTEEETKARARVAVLGLSAARELFGGANPVGETIRINRTGFLVIGILPEKGSTGWRDQDDVVMVPISTAMRRLLGKEHVESIDIEVAEASAIPDAEQAVEDLIARRHRVPAARRETAFEIRNMAEIQQTLAETSRTMSSLLASIAVISLLVGGIGIMNIMLVSVTERTREIGLRKAIGARRRDILGQFLVESIVVSVTGGVTGILLGWLITLAMSHLAGWAASVTWAAVALAFLFSAAVGILFGLWPARKAASLNPIDALRYE